MLSHSLNITPLAMLSRPIAGIRKHTIIITLPGSPKGCIENLEALQTALPHAVELARGGGGDATHRNMLAGFTLKGRTERDNHTSDHSHSHSHGHGHAHERGNLEGNMVSMDPNAPLPLRPRESPYPMISFSQALHIVKSHTKVLNTIYKKVDPGLVGYVLAQDVFAKEAVPAYRASIVDGYAVIGKSSGCGHRKRLTCLSAASMQLLYIIVFQLQRVLN